MKSQRAKFLFLIFAIPLVFLLALELAFRYSQTFNDFVYRNSTPRRSDHFRLFYQIKKAKTDPVKPKVGILGTSISREGVDARMFEKQYPQSAFYNFGATLKLPRVERDLLPEYLAGNFDVIIYPISAVDIFKFSLAAGINMYPSWDLLKTVVGDREWDEVIDRQATIFWTALSIPSFTARYREVLFSAFGSWLLNKVGIQAVRDFNYFWQQQELGDELTLQKKLQYSELRTAFFDRKIRRVASDLGDMAETFAKAGVRFIIYEMPETCPPLQARMSRRVRHAGKEFSEQLALLAESIPSVEYVRAPDFACEDYADTFHLNESGREKTFAHLSQLLAPNLQVKGGALIIEDLKGKNPTNSRTFEIKAKAAEERKFALDEGEVSIKTVAGVEPSAFEKSVALREFELARPFREERSPYPGAVTASQKCPENFRAKISKRTDKSINVWRAEFPASHRRTQVCSDSEFVTKMIEQIVYCPSSKKLFTVTGSLPRAQAKPDWAEWLKKMDCAETL